MTFPPQATKIIAVHLNYRGRAAQRGRVPEAPSYFLKPPSSRSGDGDPIVRPQGTELLTFEGEIAAIVGRRARNVSPRDGASHIGWYAPANDVGLYDMRWIDRGSNLLSKGHDGFTPIGAPVAAESLDPANLVLRTSVNGEVVQEDTTTNLIFSFGLLVADLSRFITLEPGDVILAGTPAGASALQPGDVVEVELVGHSRVSNPVVEAEAPTPVFGAQPRATPAARAQALGLHPHRPVIVSAQAKAALQEVSTATLTVQLRKRGIRDSFIRGLRPTRPDLRLFGYARTLRYVPLREDVRDADTAELNAQKRAIESIEPEDVLVMDARQDPGAGTIGDILAARAMVRGAGGVVTDGGLRDSEAVARLDMPTYYQAPHAAVLGLIHYPLETDVPIACGGALVMPGDVLVGDGDGVIVLPAAMAEEVALDALAQEQREAWALERVLDGDSIRGVYPLSEGRRAEYEAWQASRRASGNGSPDDRSGLSGETPDDLSARNPT
ncbi:MAG TPA: fumarylacetoacetate hydrolase family protein [Solirubrobacteraceae bacterium]|nr:fumarylacetoacetate hydrolase family protein [Solirubrobacteraceae bacterium]